MGDIVLPSDALSPSNYVERHVLNGSDDVIKFAAGRNVVLSIEESGEPRERDSGRMHTTLLSEYKWERREFEGNLLSVHGKLIAYRILSDNNDSVRVIERENKQRQLIKGFRSPTSDIAWAPHSPILAVVDQQCNLYVYQVDEECTVKKYVNIMWDESLPITSPSPRISWCGYVPEGEEEEDELNLLTVYQGAYVHIINLSIIRDSTDCPDGKEVTFGNIRDMEGALHTMKMEENVCAVCVSPDATAVAVAVADGTVLFYMMEAENEKKIAQTWKPDLGGHALSQLMFLDVSNTLKSQDQFWRHCVAIGDGGRRIHLFDCETWNCVGRLRFDFPLNGSAFTVHIDQYAKYLHVVDVDGANMFSVELDYSTVVPSFSSVTQISFCHPIVTAVPYSLTEGGEEIEDNDDSFDDDGDSRVDTSKVVVHLIGINYRNLVQLDVSLDKTTDNPVQCDTVDMGNRDALGSLAGTSGLLHVSTGNHPSDSDPTVTIPVTDIQNSLDEISEKIERLTLRAERADSERRAAATNEDILQLLKQFKEEFSLREDRLMANISDLIETNRNETITVVRNALNENSLAVENSIQANQKMSVDSLHQRVADKTREAVAQIVVPSIERTCNHMFKQMNEQFRIGLEQYLTQMRALQSAQLVAAATVTPAPLANDRQMVVQQLQVFVQSGNIASAFEAALNLGDQDALMYVCHQVNPEELFSTENVLPQPVLISLLQQLARRLELETDLKFRYMEYVLTALNVYDAEISLHVPVVLNMVAQELKDFQLLTKDNSLRRQARMIAQVANNMIKI